jgi:hypothetical protein
VTTAYPLAWPSGWPRTPVAERGKGWHFREREKVAGTRLVTFVTARDKLYRELERLGAESVVISCNHKPGARRMPIEAARAPADDAIAVYFSLNGKQLVMACDRYQSAAANMTSVRLAIEAMRQLERHGGGTMMNKAFEGFEALPAPGSIHWAHILGVPQTARRDDIERAFREKAREIHPDRGGSSAGMAELNLARERALRECQA